MKLIYIALSGALLMPSPSIAQVSPLIVGAQESAVLRSGTSVPLRTLTELTTEGKRLRVGHRFELEVSEPVSVNGAVVIPVGATAVGEVTHVRNKGMWGRSGGIEARLLYVRTAGGNIRLSGQMDDRGVTGTAGVVGAVALAPVVGFFVTGTSARIPAGTDVVAFVEEDVPVSFAAQVQPLVVPAPLETPVPSEE